MWINECCPSFSVMIRKFWILIILPVVFGCGSQKSIKPVQDISTAVTEAQTEVQTEAVTASLGTYRVRKGDTLYSIAFLNGLDYRDVARANNISPPFTIYVGQNIVLDVYTAVPEPAESSRSSAEVTTTRPEPAQSSRPSAEVTTRPEPVQSSRSSAKVTSSPEPAESSRPTAKVTTSPEPVESSQSTGEVAIVSTPPQLPGPPENDIRMDSSKPESKVTDGLSWQWPLRGKLVNKYSLSPGNVNKGVDIRGNDGDQVNAAADGVVVYVGEQKRYGNLVIVRHNDEYLSAYSNNQDIRVHEGEVVKQGQILASIGSNAPKGETLHFEIRLKGEPVDPLRYLPSL